MENKNPGQNAGGNEEKPMQDNRKSERARLSRKVPDKTKYKHGTKRQSRELKEKGKA